MIPGCGNPNAEIMIINSYATDRDKRNGVATMAPQLTEFLDRAKLSLDTVYYTNAIKTWYPQGTKFKVKEMNAEKPALLEEIEKVNPRFILVIGAQALKMTIGGAITTLNGTIVEHEGRKYVPTYSPGIIFRDPGKAPFVNEALATFENMLKGDERTLPDLDVRIVTSISDVKRSIRYLKRKGYLDVSYDIETTGLNRFSDVITFLGYGNDKVQYIIPLEVKYSPLRGKRIAQTGLIRYTIKALNTLNNRIAGNGKFDNLFLLEHFKIKPDLTFDVVLASHILNENTPNGVNENAILECGALDWDIPLNQKKGGLNSREQYEELITYLGYDIYYEYSLYKVFWPRIQEDRALEKLYTNLYMPVIKAYEEVEAHGVYVYQKQFKHVEEKLTKDIKEIEDKLEEYKPGVNWGSPQQVAEFLYEDLGLPILETTASGAPATGESTLMQLRDKHPAVELILKHRGVKIQISHFVDGWISRMHKGRLHPNFKMLTVTGRTSCTNPNLQQVPRDPLIRNLIGAPPGRSFVEIDFSQAELRVATILSGDKRMTEIYLSDS